MTSIKKLELQINAEEYRIILPLHIDMLVTSVASLGQDLLLRSTENCGILYAIATII